MARAPTHVGQRCSVQVREQVQQTQPRKKTIVDLKLANNTSPAASSIYLAYKLFDVNTRLLIVTIRWTRFCDINVNERLLVVPYCRSDSFHGSDARHTGCVRDEARRVDLNTPTTVNSTIRASAVDKNLGEVLSVENRRAAQLRIFRLRVSRVERAKRP